MNTASMTTRLLERFDSGAVQKIDLSAMAPEKDLLSSVFEKVYAEQKRKELGQFFTHKELVNFIIANIPITENSLVLDPACGAGAFLIASLDKNKLSSKNIYGIDIDPAALSLCSLNLELSTSEKKFNLVCADSINSFDLSTIFPEVAAAGGFDVIIGNPPFKNLKSGTGYNLKNDAAYRSMINGVANSATLMIAKGYSMLKDGGYLGFVLPKNILRVDSFKKLRKFLVENTRLVLVYDIDHYFKDVRGDQIILIFQKKKLTEEEQKVNMVTVSIHKKGRAFDDPYTYELSQKDFSKFEVFPIFYYKEMAPLAKKLRGIKTTLESVTEGKIFRGLAIGANNSAVSKSRLKNAVPTYRGDSIRRFGTKYQLYLDLANGDSTDQSRLNRLLHKKIILQNITSREGGIFAALSDENELTLDTVTNVLIDEPRKRKFILGLLNSKLSNFFIIFVTFLHSNFTMHTDKRYIGKLPVIIPEDKDMDEVVSIVDKLLVIDDKYSKEFFGEYDKLNKKLFEIYNLDDAEIQTVEQCLKEILSGKQYGRTNE